MSEQTSSTTRARRWPRRLLGTVLATATGVAVVRAWRLKAATQQFHERHGAP